MRIGTGVALSFVAFGLATAGPAAAQSTVATVAGLMPAAKPWQLTPGAIDETSTPLIARVSKLRLRTDTPPIGDVAAMRLQHRYASAMVDVFPIDGTGFRFSFGTRYHIRRNFGAEGEGFGRGLLFTPRYGSGGAGRRNGFNKMNPAVTAGYTETLGSHVSLGFEVGERMGLAIPRGPRVPRLDGLGLGRGARSGADSQFHPVASLTFGATF